MKNFYRRLFKFVYVFPVEIKNNIYIVRFQNIKYVMLREEQNALDSEGYVIIISILYNKYIKTWQYNSKSYISCKFHKTLIKLL